MTRRPFRPHQKRMNAYVQRTTHPFLFVHMRLGKTLVSVRRVASYSGCPNVLVVAPYSAIDAWRKELRAEGIPWTELFGDGETRRQSLPALRGWVLTNKEIWRTAPGISRLPWHVRILDESTFVKGPFTKVTQFYNDPDAWPELVHDWRLTGTPNPESDLDFFGQTKKIWALQNYYEWRGYFFVPFGKTWRLKPRKEKEFYAILAKHCFFMSREDAGLGIRRIYETRLIKFTPTLRKIYKNLAKQFVLEIPEGQSWETQFAGVKYSWLKRICGGALPDTDGNIRGYWDGKLKELLYLLTTELKGEQVLIWAHFTEEVERITEYLQQEDPLTQFIHGKVSPKNRTILLDSFRRGTIRWLVAQPGCLAHSTDASHCDTMIYYSSPESGEIRQQSEARTESATKKTPSLIIDFMIEDSVDEVIARGHIKKESRTITTRKIVQQLQKDADVQ